MMRLTRREVLRMALATPALAVLPSWSKRRAEAPQGLTRRSLIGFLRPGFVVPTGTPSGART